MVAGFSPASARWPFTWLAHRAPILFHPRWPPSADAETGRPSLAGKFRPMEGPGSQVALAGSCAPGCAPWAEITSSGGLENRYKSLILLVPGEGFEPPACGLQNRCSTTELTRQAFETLMNFLFSSRPQAPLATFLLPDVLWPAVYGSAQCLVNASDCIGLHPRQDMGIKVERDSDL
jgi:hypothetical protein